MSDLISSVISIREFLSKQKSKIGYVEFDENQSWVLIPERKYIIPGYQREISWSKENLQILIDDLLLEDKFLGNVILSTADKKIYEIIDGQQRVTVILMILEKIKQLSEDDNIQLCEYENEMYLEFYKALQNNFVFEGDELRKYLKSDKLNQDEKMKTLWNCVCNNLDNYTFSKLISLQEHLLDSRISVLISKVDLAINKTRKVCVDYFIDINNKSVDLKCTEILKAYAFREEFDNASKKWTIIQSNEKNLCGVHYPNESIFLHYFLCVAGKNLDYSLHGLTDEYKISKKDVVYNNKKYLIGTNIEIALSSQSYFYRNMLDRILKFQEFIKLVKNDKTSPGTEFCDLFNCDEKVDYTVKSNAFVIINGIFSNSDIVPKMLIMKYYFEVLLVTNKSKDDLKLIYWINVLATFFSASKTTRKSSDAFAKIVLKKNWKELILEQAKKTLDSFPTCIGFKKSIYQDGKVTPTSGQYLARRLHGILFMFSYHKNKGWTYNEEKYRQIMSTNGSINDEHFLVNKSCKVTFTYGKNKKKVDIELSQKNKKKVSYLSNYLVIKQAINSEMQNCSIAEKVYIIEQHLKSKEKDVFADKMSEQLFLKIKDSFIGYPNKHLMEETENIEEAKDIMESYYNEIFSEEFDSYVKSILDGINI